MTIPTNLIDPPRQPRWLWPVIAIGTFVLGLALGNLGDDDADPLDALRERMAEKHLAVLRS
jgi:hypothetical protein